MENDRLGRFWEERWRIAAWVTPALLVVWFANQAALPLAAKLAETRTKLAAMRENIYEPAWLDSTQSRLRKEVDMLEAFYASRRAALNPDAGVQATVDRIRALAQRSGIEVVKTTPTLAKQDSMRVLKVRIEGFAYYNGLIAFFDSLQARHPDLYLEEMLVRRGTDRASGKLESHFILHLYGDKPGGIP